MGRLVRLAEFNRWRLAESLRKPRHDAASGFQFGARVKSQGGASLCLPPANSEGGMLGRLNSPNRVG